MNQSAWIILLIQVYMTIIAQLLSRAIGMGINSVLDGEYKPFSMLSKLNITSVARYSTFFVHGTDNRPLSVDARLQISEFVSQDPNCNSFFVYNKADTRKRLNEWSSNFKWIKPYYQMKTNPITELTDHMIKNGVGMSCTSRAELKKCLELGLRKVRIIYSNPVKDQVDLRWAHDNGIQLTVADSIDQLIKIKQLAPKMGILWRISPAQVDPVHRSKFGDQLYTEESIVNRMKQIKDLGIRLAGIHFHCSPLQHKSQVFKNTIQLAEKCIQLGREHKHKMEIMNVGGAFRKDSISQEDIDSLKITKDNSLGYTVIAEPGRYFCSNSCYLLTRVLAKRVKSGKPCYQINDSLYHAFNCILLDGVSFENKKDAFYSKVKELPRQDNLYVKKSRKNIQNDVVEEVGELEDSTIFGMTCDGLDIIANNFAVPKDLSVGDWLCFSGMGANTYGPRTTFNGMRSIQKIITWENSVQDLKPTIQQETPA